MTNKKKMEQLSPPRSAPQELNETPGRWNRAPPLIVLQPWFLETSSPGLQELGETKCGARWRDLELWPLGLEGIAGSNEEPEEEDKGKGWWFSGWSLSRFLWQVRALIGCCRWRMFVLFEVETPQNRLVQLACIGKCWAVVRYKSVIWVGGRKAWPLFLVCSTWFLSRPKHVKYD